jgi:hypothetical protein
MKDHKRRIFWTVGLIVAVVVIVLIDWSFAVTGITAAIISDIAKVVLQFSTR